MASQLTSWLCSLSYREQIREITLCCPTTCHLSRSKLSCRSEIGHSGSRSILGWQRFLEAAKLFRSTANISAILAFAHRFGLALSSRLAAYRISWSARRPERPRCRRTAKRGVASQPSRVLASAATVKGLGGDYNFDGPHKIDNKEGPVLEAFFVSRHP